MEQAHQEHNRMASQKWWQTAVFYQIYPRSFADGNGDGIGDFRGMIEKLDYLQSLGIEGIWLSPHFPSPQKDCGYDISDYSDVAPEYGTLDDFREFLAGAHQRGIRVVLDLVLNHTSDQHGWFLASRSSREDPKRDWYIWKDALPDGSPPNNWYSTFGGSAWEWDEQTQQYYYHFFFKEQPDLNWRNPEVQKAMFDAVRFWLDMGVDGFRLDAIGTLYEDPDFPDQAAGITQKELFQMSYLAKTEEEKAKTSEIWETMFIYQHDMPGVHEMMQALRALVDTYEDRVLIGETDEISFYGSGDDELHLIFNFPLMRTERLTPAWVRENQRTRLAQLPSLAWPCNTLGNHDSPRMLSRYGDGQNDAAIARQNLVMLLALKGTPFLYNGEEIGMRDYRILDISLFRDLLGVWYAELAKELAGMTDADAAQIGAENGRDKCRTPNQWANAENAGFSPPGVTTWLPVNPDYAQGVNAADQESDPDSMLNFYRRAVAARQASPALVYGDYQSLIEEEADLLVFSRSAPDQRCLAVFNVTGTQRMANLDLPVASARLLFSTHARQGALDWTRLSLAPYEAVILELD
jgi:alpha-glucosidase